MEIKWRILLKHLLCKSFACDVFIFHGKTKDLKLVHCNVHTEDHSFLKKMATTNNLSKCDFGRVNILFTGKLMSIIKQFYLLYTCLRRYLRGLHYFLFVHTVVVDC